MNYKYLISIVMLVFLVSTISASDYLGKQYTSIDIRDNCEVDGFPCSSSYLCNITISDPDNNLLVLNSPMTRNDTVYNYTLTQTSLLGDYSLTIYCDNTTWGGNEQSILKVTTTGRTPNMMITILLLLCSLGIFLLALYLNNQAIGFISGLLFLVSGTYIMIYGLGNLADLYTRSIALVIIGFGSFVTLISGYEWLSEESE